jgi:Uma2 family endonuclease
MATAYQPYRISADQFLAMEFGPDEKVELDNGIVRMMAGGTSRHAHIQGNISSFLRVSLRSTGCTPFNSDMAARTHDYSVRYPDITVYCGNPTAPEKDKAKAFTDPRVVIEVLSPSTSQHDQREKLAEYRDLASVDTILFVDPDAERIRVIQRTGPENWTDNWLASGSDVELPSLDVTLPHSEIFARD